MPATSAAVTTLVDAAWPKAAGRLGLLRPAILAVVGSLLIAVSAKVNVPMWPVPMTLQTFAVAVVGMAYGWRLAGATLLLYLVEGAVGLPVFATGSGPAYMVGPTGGYLLGFLVAAVFLGWAAERGWDRTLVHTAAAMTAGTVVMFLFGIAWLAVFLGDLDKALVGGLYPFIAGGVVKIALAALLMPFCWTLLGRFGR
jgi:biotin transport system substrate-specific component